MSSESTITVNVRVPLEVAIRSNSYADGLYAAAQNIRAQKDG